MNTKAPLITEIVTFQSGSPTTVTDSAEMPLQDMVLYGKSEQVVTSGVNLLKPIQETTTAQGITVTKKPDGTYIFEGTCINSIYFYVAFAEIEIGKQYTFSGGVRSTDTSKYQVYIVNTDETAIEYDSQEKTFIATQTGMKLRVAVYSDATVDFAIKPMLNLGTEALPFEPYTGGKPSPSPEYPQEIVSVGERWNGKRKVVVPLNYGTDDYWGQWTELTLANNISGKTLARWNVTAFNGVQAGDIALVKLKLTDTNRVTYGMIDVVNISTSDGYVRGYFIGEQSYPKQVGIEITGRNLFYDYLTTSITQGVFVTHDSVRADFTNAYYVNVNIYDRNVIEKVRKASSVSGKRLVLKAEFDASKYEMSIIFYSQNGASYDKEVSLKSNIVSQVLSEVPNIKDLDILQLRFLRSSTARTDNTSVAKNIMLYLSDTGDDVPFEPYKEPSTTTIPLLNGLPGIPVTSGGNYTDENGQQYICDEIDFARGKYVQRVWKGVFDGDEQIGNYDSYEGFWLNELPEVMNRRTGLTNHYIVTNETVWFGVDSSTLYVINSSFYDASLSDYGLANFKAHLASNPLVVMTYLNTPIETDLTEEQLQAYKSLQTFYPTSIISNDAGAQMNVEYAADTKTWVMNKINTLIKEATTS